MPPFAPPAANDNQTRHSTREHIYFYLLNVRTQMLRRDPSQMTPAEVREWHTALALHGRMIRDIEPSCG